MNKREFLNALAKKLSALPQQDISERISFYSEMIDDRMEDGLTEEEAVLEIGSVDSIASQIISEFMPKDKVKPIKQRSFKTWEIILLILGAPIWISLLVAAFSVVLSLYVTLWALVASIWAVFVSFAACAPAGILVGIGFIVGGHAPSGMFTIGGALILSGLAVLLFFGCVAATRTAVLIPQKIVSDIKKRF